MPGLGQRGPVALKPLHNHGPAEFIPKEHARAQRLLWDPQQALNAESAPFTGSGNELCF